MRKILILLFIFSCIASNISAQEDEKPMKKKEMNVFVEDIRNLITSSDYEAAFTLYLVNKARINAKAISKADKLWWDSTVVLLEQKKALFNENRVRLQDVSTLYYKFQYRKCDEMIQTLSFDKTCAYNRDINELRDLENAMNEKREVMAMLDDKMLEFIALYQSKRYEELFPLLNTGNILGYVASKDSLIMSEICDSVQKAFKRYSIIFDNVVTKQESWIQSFPKTVNLKDAKKARQTVSDRITSLNNYDFERFDAKCYPVLHSRVSSVLSTLGKIENQLDTFINNHDPKKIIMGNLPVTEDQITSLCETDIPDFLSIINLNVLKYYDLSFSSELKKQNYISSPEYAQKLAELKTIKSEAMKTVYCQTLDVNTGNYNLEDNCFYIEIGDNSGLIMPMFGTVDVYPPKSVGKKDEKIVHEALKIETFKDNWLVMGYVNGDKYSRYFASIPVERNIAANYEKTKCTLMICFTPVGVKQYKFTGVTNGGRGRYDVYDVKKDMPYSSTCRIFLVTDKGEIIYDKILKK